MGRWQILHRRSQPENALQAHHSEEPQSLNLNAHVPVNSRRPGSLKKRLGDERGYSDPNPNLSHTGSQDGTVTGRVDPPSLATTLGLRLRRDSTDPWRPDPLAQVAEHCSH